MSDSPLFRRESPPGPAGAVRISRVDDPGSRDPFGWCPLTPWRHNLVLYEWGAIAGHLLAAGSSAHKISAMYIEYENVADPDDAAVAPEFGREPAAGVAYYNGLAASGTRDYLRVPLIAATLSSSDPARYPQGNLPTFFTQTSGVVGVHGKPFSDAVNSRIFGAALVAAVDWADATQDLVFSRTYFAPEDQQVKLANRQFGLTWEIALK